MENVVAFNNELSGLYESKPPISKAKMAAITRAAMRAIKFYKHVVQSVEKFILKCKPEYKVPGLYVIDSIVRQSRHQYGPEKDVFAPRFARNMKDTFANLFRCAPEDKSRIIRVLNLWQKNNVFAPDVIQPIFDLADPNHPIYSMPPPGASGSSAGPSGSGNISMTDISGSQANGGLNTSGGSMDMSLGVSGSGAPQSDDKPPGGLADLSNNNLKQLLNDPNVLRQLQTLQNFTKFKQDDKQHNLRLQEEAFEKHLQNVLKNSASNSGSANQEANDFNKEVEFVSEEQKIEVITLDGNDSRSPTPDRERYKRRRSRSRSRSRDRGARNRRGRSRSRSRSRSPRSNRRRNSRDRERTNRDKEKEREHERERRKKGLPDLKKDHLSVCSTTLWVGHLSKLVYQEELSDTFGEYGDIVSIDQIVPRGCAFIVMNRRQDAHKAMQALKNYKLQGRAITISWAAGKGIKSKEWKDFWDLELGVTYIPWSKLDEGTDLDALEEGGMFDEDSMPGWMKEKINKLKSLKEGGGGSEHLKLASGGAGMSGPPPALPPGGNPGMMFGIDTTQPPPGPPPTGGPPPMLPMVPGQFSMAPPMGGPPRMLGPHMGLPISGIHMPPNIVPPHAMMMMPGFGMAGPGGAPPMGPPHMPPMGGHPTQFPPPGGPPATASMASNVSSDDQMDIEMEDEEGATVATASSAPAGGIGNGMNFSQPPPAFAGGSAENPAAAAIEPFSRERNRGGVVGSRWGGRGGGAGPDEDVNEGRWRENGGPPPQGGPHNFPDSGPRNPGGPHRPDFMNDFDKRGGPGPRGGGHNFNGGGGDFHPNMQNRFNQPTNLMQMRIPPPNAFNQRGGPGGGGAGPPMFMRGGQGGPGGQGGGRQQGPGFFNRNNPFDRDINEGFGGRGRGRGGGRGGSRGGRGGGFAGGPHAGNWSDEEGDDGGFKRRGAGGMGGNRFRDREGSADRFTMRDNNSRGARRGPGGPPRERSDSDRERDNRAGRGPSAGSVGRRLSRDNNNKKKPRFCDTEEDWDRELEEYDGKSDKKQTGESPTKTSENASSIAKTAGDNSKTTTSSNTTNDTDKVEKQALPANDKKTETKDIEADNETKAATPLTVNTPPATVDDSDKNTKSATPLYDELPPPKANTTNKPATETTTTADSVPADSVKSATSAATAATAPPVTEKPLPTPPAAAAEAAKPAATVEKPAATAEEPAAAVEKPAATADKPADTIDKASEHPPPAVNNSSNNTKESVTQSSSEGVSGESKSSETSASDKVAAAGAEA